MAHVAVVAFTTEACVCMFLSLFNHKLKCQLSFTLCLNFCSKKFDRMP